MSADHAAAQTPVTTATGEAYRLAGIYALEQRKAKAEATRERRPLSRVELAELARITEALRDLEAMGPRREGGR